VGEERGKVEVRSDRTPSRWVPLIIQRSVPIRTCKSATVSLGIAGDKDDLEAVIQRSGVGSISIVAGARNYLQANRSLAFRFEVVT
jgi:hypothetical protein